MNPSDVLVSVGLPVRNGADRIGAVIQSVLAQDHQNIELLISDNASTDDTEDVCRDLARVESRIVYHRHPHNIGLTNNFVSITHIAKGAYLRWIGDDDWLAPDFVSRTLECFVEDERRLIVTTQVAYTGPDGVTRSDTSYDGSRMASLDPVERLREIMRLLNESYLLVDPLYALVRREPVAAIPRRNMLREDEVFATKLALAGPWGHVPRLLARRNTKAPERMPQIARTLEVPGWQAHIATTLECREILGWIGQSEFTKDQKRQARTAVARMYLRRQNKTYARRGRKLARMAFSAIRSSEQTVSVGR
jgi:cellulose synthase/poly-beta-1,6-N-acetylglucosamine synthase-like glycosyltransferase